MLLGLVHDKEVDFSSTLEDQFVTWCFPWSARMIRARQGELQGFGGISFSWLNCLSLYSMQFAFGAWIVFVDTWAYQGDKSLGQRCRCVNMPEWQFRGYLNINHCVDCVLWNPLKNWCDFEAQVLPHAITRFAGELVLEMMPSSPGDEPMSFHPSDKKIWWPRDSDARPSFCLTGWRSEDGDMFKRSDIGFSRCKERSFECNGERMLRRYT